MKPTLLYLLVTLLSLHSHAQSRGRCGSNVYEIKGEKISRLIQTDSVTHTITTYALLDEARGHLWVSKEISAAERSRIARFESQWTNIAELDTSSLQVGGGEYPSVLIRLKSSQQFFFTTIYTDTKNGPLFEVRKSVLLLFENQDAAGKFIAAVRQYLRTHPW